MPNDVNWFRNEFVARGHSSQRALPPTRTPIVAVASSIIDPTTTIIVAVAALLVLQGV